MGAITEPGRVHAIALPVSGSGEPPRIATRWSATPDGGFLRCEVCGQELDGAEWFEFGEDGARHVAPPTPPKVKRSLWQGRWAG